MKMTKRVSETIIRKSGHGYKSSQKAQRKFQGKKMQMHFVFGDSENAINRVPEEVV